MSADRPRAFNSTLPARTEEMPRGSGFRPAVIDGSGAPVMQLRQRVPIKPVSDKRQRENRQRRAMADRLWPDRREGTVLCAVWEAIQPDWCDRRASDLHEIVRRGQGGSITSEENTTPVCRPCNGLLADGPDWGYRIGVIKHDALCCRGRAVCSRYDGDGAA